MERDNLIGAKKDKTVLEETLDPEIDIDGQVESEQVDGAELGVEMQGQDESGKLEAEPGENDSNECSLLFAGDIYFSNHVLNAYDRVGGIGGVLGESLRETIAESDIFLWQTWNFRSATGEHRRRINSLRSRYRRPACLFYRRSTRHRDGGEQPCARLRHGRTAGHVRYAGQCRDFACWGGKNLEEAKQPQIIEKNGKRLVFWARRASFRRADGRQDRRIRACFRRMTRLRSCRRSRR